MNEHYINIKDIAEAIGICPKDKIYLSSDVMALALIAKKNGEKFNADLFIDSILERITEEGTLMIPTFHFDFSNKGIYDYRKTPSATGALGNVVLNRSDFKRTTHPMHSFCVWGKDKDKLCGMQNLNSFGTDSPFGYMYENDVIQIMLGTDYQRSMTFVHYVENMAEVPYRYYKEFTGKYIDEKGRETVRTYQYPARKLELGSVEKFNRIGKKLEEQHAAQSDSINGVCIRKVYLAKSYSIIYEDAKNNMCRNLYDFNMDRSLIWA